MSALPFADLLRIALVLVLAACQALAAYWPELTGARETITTRSARWDTRVVPFGPFFAIWLLLFSACGAFAVWHALPAQASDPTYRTLGWLAAALFAGNVAWEVWVPRRGLGWPSVALIVLELAVALAALAVIAGWGPTGWDLWLGAVPLQLFAGWVSVAAFANLSSTLRRAGLADARRAAVAGPLIGAAVLLVAAVGWWTGSPAYLAAAGWGLAGIAVKAAVGGSGAAG